MRFALASISLVFLAGSCHAQQSVPIEEIREMRLRGQLDEARSLAERELRSAQQRPARAIDLRLELARIHDRIGLHQNTRPVEAALAQIDSAASSIEETDINGQARIELARADYYYRAEMSQREFPVAGEHAQRAIQLFQDLGARHEEAEAVHRLGLIYLQRGDLHKARELFDRSLTLDDIAGARPFFRGEYERHVGFVYRLEGDLEASVPYFERSLAYRRQVGAIDASLFAATALASVLIDLGRTKEARPHALYAMMVAERLDSPVGKTHTGLILGALYEHDGDMEAARIAYEMTSKIATIIGYESVASLASEALQRLQENE